MKYLIDPIFNKTEYSWLRFADAFRFFAKFILVQIY